MKDTLLNLLFRCSHRRLSRPVTPVRRGNEPGGETYVVCLDCGEHFSYDAMNMRLGRRIPRPGASK
jgi:DNA-directed RNA polymerase subunit RPC12/RpoP